MADIVGSLLSKIDIVSLIEEYTELTPSNNSGELRGVCPIHPNASNPTSFAVFEEKYFKCFGCGCYGSAIQFYCDVENLPFHQGLEELAEKYQINLADNQQYQRQRSIVEFNTRNMAKYLKEVDKVKKYLIEKRGLTEESIAEFKIGFDEQGKFLSNPEKSETIFAGIVFPIMDSYGRVSGFSKRRAGSDIKPTYRNSYEDKDGVFKKGEILFNYNRIRKTIQKDKTLYLAEGFFDCISAHQQGLNSVGYLSGGLTKEHINILKSIDKMNQGMTFVASMDNDTVGFKETIKLRSKLDKYNANLNVRVFCYPKEEYTFPNGETRQIKDFNDILQLNLKIAEFPTKHIDLYCLEVLLDNCKGAIESEYREVDLYVKSVKNSLIIIDIAKMLTKRWNELYNAGLELADVKEYLKVRGESKDDEILAEFATVGDAIDKYLSTMEDDSNGIGFPKIDYSFGGVQKKEVFLIGAYSKIGKTDFICEIMLHSILRLKMNCLMFSMEMPKEGIIRRMLMKLFNVTKRKLKEMMKSPDSATFIMEAREKLEKYLLIVDTNNLSIEEIKQRIKIANLYKFDTPVRRVFVDYFQYMKNTTEFADIEASAKAMKPLCKDMDIELYMLSQFSRNDRPWERPSIASFKGGNSLESSFDKCVLLWRPSKNPKLSNIERDDIKYQTMVAIESREEMYGEDTFELAYDPDTSRLLEKEEIEELKRLRSA